MSTPNSAPDALVERYASEILKANEHWAKRLNQTFPEYFPPPGKQAPKVCGDSVPLQSRELGTYPTRRSFGSDVRIPECRSRTQQRRCRALSLCIATLLSASDAHSIINFGKPSEPSKTAKSMFMMTMRCRSSHTLSGPWRSNMVRACIDFTNRPYLTLCSVTPCLDAYSHCCWPRALRWSGPCVELSCWSPASRDEAQPHTPGPLLPQH